MTGVEPGVTDKACDQAVPLKPFWIVIEDRATRLRWDAPNPAVLRRLAGVQADTESWPVDAEWGPDGALCFNHNRGGVKPPCYTEKHDLQCGSFSSGALLIDEYNGQ